MDVRCSRCSTEYEFDDALISEKGTTVKCTNCGHQFKVFPARGGAGPELWVVKSTAGGQSTFNSLRELQRAITDGRVHAQDLLSRGNSPPRPLAVIAELEPFFQQGPPSSSVPTPRTLYGVAPPANTRKGGDGPPSLGHAPAAESEAARKLDEGRLEASELGRWRMPGAPPARIPTPNLGTISPGAADAGSQSSGVDAAVAKVQEQTESAPTIATANESMPEPPTIPRTLEADSAPAPQSVELSPTVQASPAEARAWPSTYPTDPSPGGEDLDEPMQRHSSPGRKARSRWIFVVVVVAAGGLLAATVGRRFVARYLKVPDTASATDSRVEAMLSTGERKMAASDLEGAKEEFARASALAERDPKVLLALAELEVARADLFWLRLRLLPDEDETEEERGKLQFSQQLERAKAALRDAKADEQADPALLRASIDLERLAGNLSQARDRVGSLSAETAAPQNAYVLGALDLAESEPPWPSIVQRLRSSLSAKVTALRSRPALIYALVRSGKAAQAQVELSLLEESAPHHPLLIDLKAFVSRASGVDLPADAGTDATPPNVGQTARGTSPSDSEAGGEDLALDFRQQLTLAGQALQAGDLARADQLYRAVASKHPGNTEALAGLGDVASRRNDGALAMSYYDKVLTLNPSYLPALMGSADQKWSSGDQAGAAKLYRRVVDQVGDSGYGKRAKQRLNQFEGEGPKPEPPVLGPEAQTTPPEPEAPEKPETPHIDTTDLPGFSQ